MQLAHRTFFGALEDAGSHELHCTILARFELLILQVSSFLPAKGGDMEHG